jgi:hypothetical protein
MPLTLNGSGTIAGLSVGGLPDGVIENADIANATITAAKLDGAQSGSAPIYAARAWVNFDGTGTVAIRASGNVSSITDNGTGYYTVNFTTAMPDVNYVALSIGSDTANTKDALINLTGMQTNSVQIQYQTSGVSVGDTNYGNVAIFR